MSLDQREDLIRLAAAARRDHLLRRRRHVRQDVYAGAVRHGAGCRMQSAGSIRSTSTK